MSNNNHGGIADRKMIIVNFSDYRNQADLLDQAFGNNWIYCGRWSNKQVTRSPLANPFYNKEDPGSTLQQYKKWLWNKIRQRDIYVLKELTKLAPDSVLVCHCEKPDQCHCSVIRDMYYNFYIKEAGKPYRLTAEELANIPKFKQNYPTERTWSLREVPTGEQHVPAIPDHPMCPFKPRDRVDVVFKESRAKNCEIVEIRYNPHRIVDSSGLKHTYDEEGKRTDNHERWAITYCHVKSNTFESTISDGMALRIEKRKVIFDSSLPEKVIYDRKIPVDGDLVRYWDRYGNKNEGIVIYVETVTEWFNKIRKTYVREIHFKLGGIWQIADGGGWKIITTEPEAIEQNAMVPISTSTPIPPPPVAFIPSDTAIYLKETSHDKR